MIASFLINVHHTFDLPHWDLGWVVLIVCVLILLALILRHRS